MFALPRDETHVAVSSDQLRQAWHALRQGLRNTGVRHRGDLLEWLRQNGYGCLGAGEYFEQEGQEYILELLAEDVPEVGHLYEAYICIAMSLARSQS
eukprot:5011341-Karenia_brevis.AAC.1